MLSLPLCYTHDWITSCGTWNNCPWEAHMVGPCQAWHTISPFDSTRSENFWMTLMWYAIIALNNTQCGTTFMWHAIIAFGLHTQMYDVGRGMSSSPLCSTHGRTMLGMPCQYRHKEKHKVGRHRAWHDIISHEQHTQGRTTSGVASNRCPRTKHTVRRRRAWDVIIALGLHIWLNNLEHHMVSSPLVSTHR